MSQMTKEINKITGTIISVSGKLILYAVIILLLFEGMSKGYQFGHDIFYPTAMEAAPGSEKVVTITKGQSVSESAHMLSQAGLIDNELAFQVQMKFYEYKIYPGSYTLNTSMTSKDILQVLNEKPEVPESKSSAEAAQIQDAMLDLYGANADKEEANGQNDSADEGMELEDQIDMEIQIEDEAGEDSQ